MKVFTKWPALVPAIRRAGHEPVLVDSECEIEPDPMSEQEHLERFGPYVPECDGAKEKKPS